MSGPPWVWYHSSGVDIQGLFLAMPCGLHPGSPGRDVVQ